MDVRFLPAPEVRVDDGLADGQLALGLDVDMQMVGGDDGRVDDGRDRERVVDRGRMRTLRRFRSSSTRNIGRSWTSGRRLRRRRATA